MRAKLLAFLFVFTMQLSAEKIVFNDMQEHKQRCLAEMISNPRNIGPHCPLKRAILTINADDADYIPKVPDAGKIFEENGVRYQLMHNGIKVLENGYYSVTWMTDVIYALRGHHEPQEEKVFYEVLKYIPEGATMIELGAYWGYYSLWFSEEIQGAKNFLIEPIKENMEVGKINFALNGKEADFTLGYILLHPSNPTDFRGAQRIFVDQFIRQKKIKHVHILHADIQEAEYQMLLTCRRSIKNKQIDYFFISTHTPAIHESCRNFLEQADYIIIAEHTMAETCSADGLIVARRRDVPGPDHISVNKYPWHTTYE